MQRLLDWIQKSRRDDSGAPPCAYCGEPWRLKHGSYCSTFCLHADTERIHWHNQMQRRGLVHRDIDHATPCENALAQFGHGANVQITYA